MKNIKMMKKAVLFSAFCLMMVNISWASRSIRGSSRNPLINGGRIDRSSDNTWRSPSVVSEIDGLNSEEALADISKQIEEGDVNASTLQAAINLQSQLSDHHGENHEISQQAAEARETVQGLIHSTVEADEALEALGDLKELLNEYNRPDASEINNINPDSAAEYLLKISPEAAASILAEMDSDVSARILEAMDNESAASIVNEIDGEKAAYIFTKMNFLEDAAAILSNMEEKQAAAILEAKEVSGFWRNRRTEGIISSERASAIFSRMDADDAASILNHTEIETAAGITANNQMSLNDAAEILSNMEEKQAAAILEATEVSGFWWNRRTEDIISSERASEILSRMDADDAASILNHTEIETAAGIIRNNQMSLNEGAEILGGMEEKQAAAILEATEVSGFWWNKRTGNIISSERASAIFSRMDADDAASILNEMDTDRVVDLMNELSLNSPENTAEILNYMNLETAIEILSLMDTQSAGKIIVEWNMSGRDSIIRRADIFSDMDTDIAADILSSIPPHRAYSILSQIRAHIRKETAVAILSAMDDEDAVRIYFLTIDSSFIPVLMDFLSDMDPEDVADFVTNIDVRYAYYILTTAIDYNMDEETVSAVKSAINVSERIFEEYGVFLVGNYNERNEQTVNAVLESILPAMQPPGIFFDHNIDDFGLYIPSVSAVAIRSNMFNLNTIRVLYHEIGHYVDYELFDEGMITMREGVPSRNSEWSRLWDESSESEDYARMYGEVNAREDFATMFEAYTINTRYFIIQTMENTRNSGRDVRLRKFEYITDLFAHEHTLEDGTVVQATYVYEFNFREIIRRTVALAETEINGETYLLPDFNAVYDTQHF